MNKLLPTIFLAALALLIEGCAARPEMPARSAANTAGVDLSGHWVLRTEDGAPPKGRIEPDQRIYIPPSSAAGRSQQGAGRSSGRRSKGPAVHVFIENGESLQITQTAHGIFVSFDRAVVEEYTFGENRIVTLGPIEAQRVSGWDGPVFVVETMDDRGAKLTETWTLAGDGSELVREIGIVDGAKELYSTRRVFDRS
jgi:hypothetical protein